MNTTDTARTEQTFSFSTSEQAWEFMRKLDARQIPAGFPSLDGKNTVRALLTAEEQKELSTAAKSEGHICFTSDGTVEFFEQSGEVYRASANAPLADRGVRRHGRWEASRNHFERFRSVVVW